MRSRPSASAVIHAPTLVLFLSVFGDKLLHSCFTPGPTDCPRHDVFGIWVEFVSRTLLIFTVCAFNQTDVFEFDSVVEVFTDGWFAAVQTIDITWLAFALVFGVDVGVS